MRDYTPEYESFREDAVAILGGSAVVIAVVGTWARPALTGPVALVLALMAYVLSPRSKGGVILAVLIITLFALIFGAWQGHSLY